MTRARRSLTVTGGVVVTPDGAREADVVIEGERITAVERPALRSGQTVDARGCVVMPGGVDPHAHALADIVAATQAALRGGTTTVLSFTLPRRGESVIDAVERAQKHLLPLSAVDVELHAYVTEPDLLTREQIERAAALGVTGIKLFMAFPELGLQASDRVIYETLRTCREFNLPVLIHCENGSLIEALIAEHLAAGHRHVRWFALSRPPAVEIEAINRALAIAELADSGIYVVHVSTAAGIECVRQARVRGVEATLEACTHHLALDASLYDGPEAARFLIVPPLRRRDHLEALWDAVADGTIDTVGSDHAAERYQPPLADDFTGLPYSFPGLEERLPILLSLGAERGVALERLVDLVSVCPAKTFGLYPRKGAVAPGSDADLVVWDPEPSWKIGGNTPYKGLEMRGKIRQVIRRGAAALPLAAQ
jgi:dihydropyrimidinase